MSGCCPICGADFDGLRSDATYCGSACRREASRRRRLDSGSVAESQAGDDDRAPQKRAERRLIRSAHGNTPDQPNRRVAVTHRIIAELNHAGNVPFTPELMGWPGYPGPLIGRPEGRTYVELARAVYETSEPTVAQVKAVQRAAKRLATAGRIETSWHQRDAFEVVVRRLPTADDHRCRAEVERREREWKVARAEAVGKASNYPIDTGTTGIVEVAVEPVLKITADGVELREVGT